MIVAKGMKSFMDRKNYMAKRPVYIELDMQPLHNGNMPLPADAVSFAESELVPAIMCTTDVPALVSFRDDSCDGRRLRNGLVRYRIRGSIVLSDMLVSSQEEAERAADRMVSSFMKEKDRLMSYSIVCAEIGKEEKRKEKEYEEV